MRYANLNAAVDQLQRDLGFLRTTKKLLEREGLDRLKPEMYQPLKQAIELLGNREELKRRLKKFQSPDGSLTITFSPEALALLQEKERTG